MNIDILAFGIAKDILGTSEKSLKLDRKMNIRELKELLEKDHPDFSKLKSFSIAVNQEYQEDDYELQSHDEVAIIPPVSGG